MYLGLANNSEDAHVIRAAARRFLNSVRQADGEFAEPEPKPARRCPAWFVEAGGPSTGGLPIGIK